MASRTPELYVAHSSKFKCQSEDALEKREVCGMKGRALTLLSSPHRVVPSRAGGPTRHNPYGTARRENAREASASRA